MLSVPSPLRYLFATNPKVMGQVLTIVHSIQTTVLDIGRLAPALSTFSLRRHSFFNAFFSAFFSCFLLVLKLPGLRPTSTLVCLGFTLDDVCLPLRQMMGVATLFPATLVDARFIPIATGNHPL